MAWTPQVPASAAIEIPAQPGQAMASRRTDTQAGAPNWVEGVEVVARRGATRFAPEREYGAEEIDTLGASDIGEVIGRFNDAAGGRGSPVVIVNGQRLADPDAFLPFPPDALARVEMLPPAAAAAYGSADPSRRVINIVLQRRFDGRDASASLAHPTSGDQASSGGDLRRAQIVDLNTSRLGLRLSRDTSLRADERPDYRRDHPESGATSLRPQSNRTTLDLSLTRMIGAWNGSLVANAQKQTSTFVSNTGGRDIRSRTDQRALALNSGLGGQALGWSVRGALTGQVSRVQSAGLSLARTDSHAVYTTLSMDRSLLRLPAGPITLDVSGQASRSRASTRLSGSRRGYASQTASAGFQLSVPISRSAPTPTTDRRGVGDLSINLGAAERSTGAARGTDINTSFYWTPIQALGVNGAWSRSINAPSDDQRFAPSVYAEPITVFDFRTGRSVTVLPLTGGNPDLRSPKRESQMIGVSMGPFGAGRMFGSLSYRRSAATDEIGVLSEPTLDIEAAFPDRFGRNTEGVLVSVDRRPINFASDISKSLTTTLTATLPLPNPGSAGPSALQLSLNHVWRLKEVMRVHPGLPPMDRLAGDGGAAPRQELSLRATARRGRIGGDLSVHWKDAYRIRAQSGHDGARDLKVGAVSRVNLKLTYIFSTAAGASSRRGQGATLTIDVDNLFDARPRARLDDGAPAPGYGRDDRDPVGRLVRLAVASRF